MSPVVLYFASGESLYAGAVLLLLAIVVSRIKQGAWLRLLRNVTAWLGLVLMAMACPPFPWAVDVVFLAVFALWFLTTNRTSQPSIVAKRTAATLVLAALLLILPTVEFFHRGLLTITGMPSDHLVIIGDSISAGFDQRVPAWPAVMQQMTGVPIKNLAQPGAGTVEGLAMAAKVRPEDRVVLIEIGGNDLLSGVPSAEFAQHLDAILARLASPGRILLMFELPLLPHRIEYGRTQRRLAQNYGVLLIPKRYFTAVISGASATSDGLHLSDVGAHRMAELVAKALSVVLKPSASVRQWNGPTVRNWVRTFREWRG